jgi:hypothetical protein
MVSKVFWSTYHSAICYPFIRVMAVSKRLGWKKKSRKVSLPFVPVLVILLVVVGFGVYYLTTVISVPQSNVVLCRALSYGVFTAVNYVGNSPTTLNYTETTTTVFTTITETAAPIGHVISTHTSYVNSSGFVSYGGFEYCTYTTSTISG